jgi:hypothetical protein
MDLSKEIQSFIQKLVNSRKKLLAANIGNTSSPVIKKHEALTKAFDYAKSIKTNQQGWIAFLTKWESVIRFLLIANRSLAAMEMKLMLIILEISKKRLQNGN